MTDSQQPEMQLPQLPQNAPVEEICIPAESLKKNSWPISRHQLLFLKRLNLLENEGAYELEELGFKHTGKSVFGDAEMAEESMYLEHRLPGNVPFAHPTRARTKRSFSIVSLRKSIASTDPVAAAASAFATIPEPEDSAARQPHFDMLPDELIEYIMGKLEVKDVMRASEVCRRFHDCAGSREVWLTRYKEDFGWPPVPSPAYSLLDAASGRKRWMAASANALRAKVEQDVVEYDPKRAYLETWKRTSTIVRLEKWLEKIRLARRRRRRVESVFNLVQGPTLLFLSFMMLCLFGVFFPLKLDGITAIADFSWPEIFAPLFAMLGLMIVFFAMSIVATATGFKKPVLQLTKTPAFDLTFCGFTTLALLGFVIAVAVNLSTGANGGWLYVFLPLIVLQTTYIITLFIYMRTLVLGLKLVVMSWALGVGLLLTALIVIPLKLDGVITSPWYVTLTPIWILDLVIPLVAILYLLMHRFITGRFVPVSHPGFMVGMSVIGWTTLLCGTTEVLLALEYDNIVPMPTTMAFIPLFFLAVMMFQTVLTYFVTQLRATIRAF